MGSKRASGLDDGHARLPGTKPRGRNPGFAAGRARAGERCRRDRRWRSSRQPFQRGGRTDLGAEIAPMCSAAMSAVSGSGTCNSIILRRRHQVSVGGDVPKALRAPKSRSQRKDGSRIRAALSLSRVEVGGRSRTIAIRSGHHRRGRAARTAGAAHAWSPTGPIAPSSSPIAI